MPERGRGLPGVDVARSAAGVRVESVSAIDHASPVPKYFQLREILLDLGEPLRGRLLAYDALDQSFRAFKVRRDPSCPACGDGAQIVIAEYDEQCMPHAVLADGSVLTH